MKNTKGGPKSTILLVDDHPSNILVLEKLLECDSRFFLKASSGNDALKIALAKHIDLIILDVNMPDMDGFEVAQLLKTNKRTKDIPIIFASAEKKEHKFVVKGLEEGAIDYLYKPLDPEITRAKVAVQLKLQQQKKELVEKNIRLERAALLINNSADIIGIVDVNTLKFEEVNQAFTAILGYPREEVYGTSLEFFVSNEDRKVVQEIRQRKNEKLIFETKVYCKDRETKWLQWNVVVEDEKWFVNARDVTLVKQVEKIRDYLATVVKQSKDAIYIYNEDGRIISWNHGAEGIYGYLEQEALKMKIWNLIPEFLHEEMQTITNDVIHHKKQQTLETRRITKQGQLVDVLFSASVVTDPENGRRSVAITERDITQQKIAEKQILKLNSDLKLNVMQLKNTNKELESFSYSVSHDLRAPLRALHGYAKIFEEDHMQDTEPAAREVMANIQRNALKMGQLIDDLLDFSKLGKKEVRKSKVDMFSLVKNIVHDLKESIPHKASITLEPLPEVYADYSLISQVWVNVISNAIKYSSGKKKPVIKISAVRNSEEVVFCVQDNGAGFDMEYACKLFGVFQRLHSLKEFDGTGVGLAIAQRIITRHGGRIWAEGEVDKGAIFYFSLPEAYELN